MLIQIGHENYLNSSSFNTFDDLITELNDLLGTNTYIIEVNGKRIDLSNKHQLCDDETYKIWPKVLGGKVNLKKIKRIMFPFCFLIANYLIYFSFCSLLKGGFGSLLRSFGKQILISKNKEACRDLNGRRMRDVNNEKKLKVCTIINY